MEIQRQEGGEELLERLRREHRALDEQIAALEARRFLSPAEDAEVKRLKRLKLYKKDEIELLSGRLAKAARKE